MHGGLAGPAEAGGSCPEASDPLPGWLCSAPALLAPQVASLHTLYLHRLAWSLAKLGASVCMLSMLASSCTWPKEQCWCHMCSPWTPERVLHQVQQEGAQATSQSVWPRADLTWHQTTCICAWQGSSCGAPKALESTPQAQSGGCREDPSMCKAPAGHAQAEDCRTCCHSHSGEAGCIHMSSVCLSGGMCMTI